MKVSSLSLKVSIFLNETLRIPSPVSHVDFLVRVLQSGRGERERSTFCRSIDISAGLYKVISLSGNATSEIQAYSV